MNIQLSREMGASAERVYAVFTDLHGAADRVGGIESIQVLTDGPFGVGTRWIETRKMMGKLATETMWITAMDPPKSYTAEAESCGTHYTSTYTLEPTASGTRVTLSFVGRPITLTAKLLMPLGTLLMGRAIKKMVAKDLDDLAAAC